MSVNLNREIILKLIEEILKNKYDLGKTKLQKLIYFMQEGFGVPLGYRYQIYYYGPYSFDFVDDLEFLNTLGYVTIEPDEDGYGYHISLGNSKFDSKKLDIDLSEYKDKIDHVIKSFGDMDASDIELIATVHYLDKIMRSENTTTTKEKVAKEAHNLKPKFSEKQALESYNKVKEIFRN